ncbi:MAG: hypothetical protein FRX48_08225 [Lasallia pustulata]|uniref:Uncharacterized protein n=1 Tax=Lasallia pustulata TaxID=136370 RepID=A0A5M8PG95_9LECA|nr:MAG: hypothetical protein FRX48_08225 [Lasallia pustulata]
MPTPRRRSSRLRGNAAPAGNLSQSTANKLSSLLERDETPSCGAQMNLDTIVSSPVAPPNTITTQHTFYMASPTVTTPQTASRLYPSVDEMHPSKVQQSTTKQPDSGLRNGFADPKPNTSSPIKSTAIAASHDTPTKSKAPLPSHMSSPGFDFKFLRPDSDLSIEAQKIMDSVREEAARIKAQMVAERDTQARKDGETEDMYGVEGRKIVKPKGKAGRYSNVHMEEFKKMDSIAGHVSAWKTRLQPNGTSLKRSKSKAGLDEPEKQRPQTKLTKRMPGAYPGDRLENNAPGKRVKQNYQDDTSAARPVSRDSQPDVNSKQPMSLLPRSKSGLPTAISTPTKSSLARAASVKSCKSSMIPSLRRSPSTKTLGSPAVAKTEGGNKYLASLTKFRSMSNMKSILHRPPPKFSDDPVKVAAGTHLPASPGKINLDKELPSLPGTPSSGLLQSPQMKRVEFTPSTNSRYQLAATPPSPPKSPPTSSARKRTPPPRPEPIAYPSLSPIAPLTPSPTKHPAPNPADFTFRSPNTIAFGPPTSGLASPPPSAPSAPAASLLRSPRLETSPISRTGCRIRSGGARRLGARMAMTTTWRIRRPEVGGRRRGRRGPSG